jgi:hypothetical protein
MTHAEQQAMHEAMAERLAEVGYMPARAANGLPKRADGKPKLKAVPDSAVTPLADATELDIEDELEGQRPAALPKPGRTQKSR